MKRYSMSYENGKCPRGYEFVAGYTSQGVWHDSYCRKIKKVRVDPETMQREKERAEEQAIHARIFSQVLNNENPYSDTETDLSE